MQWVKNIWWMLFKAPTGIISLEGYWKCDYCDNDSNSESGLTRYEAAGLVICQHCRKKAFDSILLKD